MDFTLSRIAERISCSSAAEHTHRKNQDQNESPHGRSLRVMFNHEANFPSVD